MASELREPENKLGDFSETSAFERYACEKANIHNRAGADRPTPCTLEAQEVTTEGVYRLPHAIYSRDYIR